MQMHDVSPMCAAAFQGDKKQRKSAALANRGTKLMGRRRRSVGCGKGGGVGKLWIERKRLIGSKLISACGAILRRRSEGRPLLRAIVHPTFGIYALRHSAHAVIPGSALQNALANLLWMSLMANGWDRLRAAALSAADTLASCLAITPSNTFCLHVQKASRCLVIFCSNTVLPWQAIWQE